MIIIWQNNSIAEIVAMCRRSIGFYEDRQYIAYDHPDPIIIISDISFGYKMCLDAEKLKTTFQTGYYL